MADANKKNPYISSLQGMGGKILGSQKEVQTLAGNAGLPSAPTTALTTGQIGGSADQQKMAGTPQQMQAAIQMSLNPQNALAYQERTAGGRTGAKEATELGLPESLRMLSGLSGKIQAAATEAVKTAAAATTPSVKVMEDNIKSILTDPSQQGEAIRLATILQKELSARDPNSVKTMQAIQAILPPDGFKKIFGADEASWRRQLSSVIPDDLNLGDILKMDVRDDIVGLISPGVKLEGDALTEMASMILDDRTEGDRETSDILNMPWSEVKQRITARLNERYSNVDHLRRQASDITLPTASRTSALQRLRELGQAGQVFQAREADTLRERIERGDNILFNGRYMELDEVLSEPTVKDLLKGVLEGKVTTEQLKGTIYAPLISQVEKYQDELAQTYGISPSKEITDYRLSTLATDAANTSVQEAAWNTIVKQSANAAIYDKGLAEIDALVQGGTISNGSLLLSSLQTDLQKAKANPQAGWKVEVIQARIDAVEGAIQTKEDSTSGAIATTAALIPTTATVAAADKLISDLQGLDITDANSDEQKASLASLSTRREELVAFEQEQWKKKNIPVETEIPGMTATTLEQTIQGMQNALSSPLTPDYLKDTIRVAIEGLRPTLVQKQVGEYFSTNGVPDASQAANKDSSFISGKLSILQKAIEENLIPPDMLPAVEARIKELSPVLDASLVRKWNTSPGNVIIPGDLLTMDDVELSSAIAGLQKQLAEATNPSVRAVIQSNLNSLLGEYGKKFGADEKYLSSITPETIGGISSLEDLAAFKKSLDETIGGVTGANEKAYATLVGLITERETVLKREKIEEDTRVKNEADFRVVDGYSKTAGAATTFAELDALESEFKMMTPEAIAALSPENKNLYDSLPSLILTGKARVRGETAKVLGASTTLPGTSSDLRTAAADLQKYLMDGSATAGEVAKAQAILNGRADVLDAAPYLPAVGTVINATNIIDTIENIKKRIDELGDTAPGVSLVLRGALAKFQAKKDLLAAPISGYKSKDGSVVISSGEISTTSDLSSLKKWKKQVEDLVGFEGAAGLLPLLENRIVQLEGEAKERTRGGIVSGNNDILRLAGFGTMDNISPGVRTALNITAGNVNGTSAISNNKYLTALTELQTSNPTSFGALKSLFSSKLPLEDAVYFRRKFFPEVDGKIVPVTAETVSTIVNDYNAGKKFLQDVKLGGMETIAQSFGLDAKTLSTINMKKEFGITLPIWLDEDHDGVVDSNIEAIRGRADALLTSGMGDNIRVSDDTLNGGIGSLYATIQKFSAEPAVAKSAEYIADVKDNTIADKGTILYKIPFMTTDTFSALNTSKKDLESRRTELQTKRDALELLRSEASVSEIPGVRTRGKAIEAAIKAIDSKMTSIDKYLTGWNAKIEKQKASNPFAMDLASVENMKVTEGLSKPISIGDIARKWGTKLIQQFMKNYPGNKKKLENLIAIAKYRINPKGMTPTETGWYIRAVAAASQGNYY